MKSMRMAAVSLLSLMVGCSGDSALPTLTGPITNRSGVRASTSFTVGPLQLTGIQVAFPSDRLHFRNATFTAAVSGDLSGTAAVTLNANLDNFVGSGPGWGTMSIVTTSGDVWAGSLTGHFVSGAPEVAIQLFSRVDLHGPNGQLIKAECDETTPSSETLACTGEIVNAADR